MASRKRFGVFWWRVHNIFAHPWLGSTNSPRAWRFHDWTAERMTLPAQEGWVPTDDDVRAWKGRNDVPLSVYDCRTAIEDARIMHHFIIDPTPPTERK